MSDYSTKAHFGNYSPPAFGWGAVDPERDTTQLVPFTYNGASFGNMHRLAAPIFKAVLDDLVPHIGGSPNPVPGECGCYNPKSVTVGGDRSPHTYGIAIDVNWTQNPMYAPHHPTGDHTLPLITSDIARKYGCEWGGDWTYPQDWMHIELHLSPADARAFTGTPATDPLEEIMSFYGSKTAFENAMRTIARQEAQAANSSTPVTVKNLMDNTHTLYGSLESYLAGIPGYRSLSTRYVAKHKAAKR